MPRQMEQLSFLEEKLSKETCHHLWCNSTWKTQKPTNSTPSYQSALWIMQVKMGSSLSSPPFGSALKRRKQHWYWTNWFLGVFSHVVQECTRGKWPNQWEELSCTSTHATMRRVDIFYPWAFSVYKASVPDSWREAGTSCSLWIWKAKQDMALMLNESMKLIIRYWVQLTLSAWWTFWAVCISAWLEPVIFWSVFFLFVGKSREGFNLLSCNTSILSWTWQS